MRVAALLTSLCAAVALIGPHRTVLAQCVIFETPEDLFAHHDVVFRGTVVATEPTGMIGAHVIVDVATFRVDQVWKGAPGRDVRVGADRPFEKGKEYLVFASGVPLATSILCRAAEPVDTAKAKIEWLARTKRTG
jgi:hypothetical protein